MIQSAGIIIIDLDAQPEPCVLAVRAYAHWDFPKGILEPGESIADAAIRETAEEVSLHPLADYHIFDKGPTVLRGSGSKQKEITYYLAIRTSETEPFLPVSEELGKPENDEWHWMPLSRMTAKFRNKQLLEVVVPYIENACKKVLKINNLEPEETSTDVEQPHE